LIRSRILISPGGIGRAGEYEHGPARVVSYVGCWFVAAAGLCEGPHQRRLRRFGGGLSPLDGGGDSLGGGAAGVRGARRDYRRRVVAEVVHRRHRGTGSR